MRPLIAACMLVLVMGCDREPEELTSEVSSLAPSTSATTPSTSTTTSTTVAPSTVPPTTPAPTPPPETTAPATAAPAPAPAPVTEPPAPPTTPAAIDPTATQWVVGPEESDPQVAASPTDCAPLLTALAAQPYTVSQCGAWNADGGQRIWTITKGADARFFAYVWQESAPGVWAPVARLREPETDTWAVVNIRTGDIAPGAPGDELVSGIRIAGTGQYLTLDVFTVASGVPAVVARLPEVPIGVAVMRAGTGVEVWNAVYADGDPGCCPSAFAQHFLGLGPSGWTYDDGLVADSATAPLPVTEF